MTGVNENDASCRRRAVLEQDLRLRSSHRIDAAFQDTRPEERVSGAHTMPNEVDQFVHDVSARFARTGGPQRLLF